MDTNITIPKKEIAPGVFSTGGTATMPTVNPINNQPNVITPQSLAPVTPIQGLPTTPTTTEAPKPTPINYDEMFGLTDFQKQAEQTQEQGISEIMKSMGVLQNEATDLQAERQKQGLQDKYRENQATKARILALDAEMQQDDIVLAQKMRNEERRDTLLPFAQMGQAKLAGDAAIYRGLKTAEKNTLISQQLAQQGDIALAEQFAKDAVDAKYAPYKQNIENYKTILEIIKPSLTAAENKRLKAQEMKVVDAQNQIKKAEEEEKTSNGYLFTAIQGKAPANLIAKAQDLINKGAKPNEVAKVLGQYSMSINDRLDIQLKTAQIDKTNREINKLIKETNTDVGELVKINGKDYIRYKDGTISDPVLPEAGDTDVVVSRLDNKLKTLDKLTKGSAGLSYSAGALRTPLGKPLGFINQINDWRADAVNVIQKLTVDELGRVKSDGVTFGALSNGERQAVGDAATALGAASVRDKEGNPTGEFKMSEKKVLEEFNKIKQGYALDFERRTGIPYEQYLQNPEIVQQKSVDDFIDSAGTALINNNNYGDYPTN